MRIHPDNLFEKLGFDAIRYRLADFAHSDQAKEWLQELQPRSSYNECIRMLSQTKEVVHLLEAAEDLPIEHIPELREAFPLIAIQGNVLPLRYFLLIQDVLRGSRLCAQFIERKKEELPELSEIAQAIRPIKELEQHIARVISKEGEVRSDASQALIKTRRSLNQRRGELRTMVNRVMRKAQQDGMSEEGGITIRDGRMVIPIKAEYKRKIQGFVHDTSSTGQTVYLEPVEALHINNDIRSLEREEQKEIERILRELTARVREFLPALRINFDTLCELDHIRAKGHFSHWMQATICMPTQSNQLRLFDARNPHLLLSNLKKAEKERETVVPLQLELSENERCLIITGPNAGGKSVAMKSLGLLSCMLQSGLGIPAREDSLLPVFSGLFVDLGDNQSIENDLSTFSSRLQWMKTCAEQAGNQSLVLIDEAGAGTDPDEGSALYQALTEHLLAQGAIVVITTHHSALKVFAEEHPKAVNGSMEFSQQKLEPTYLFRKNVPGSSYAFEIARRMHLLPALIQRSKELVGSGKSKVEHLIVSLEKKEQEASRTKIEYDKLLKTIHRQKNDYETKLKAVRKKGDEIREKALVEAKRIVDQANKRVEQAVEEALRVARSKEEAQKARKGIKKLKSKIGDQLEEIDARKRKERQETQDLPKVGDRVKLADGLTFGELIELDGKKAVVMANGLRLKTRFDNLVKVEGQSPTYNQPKAKGYKLIVADADPEPSMVGLKLDLRGQRGEEAVVQLQQYLDRVYQAGLEQVEIVHGKGNGILKQLVHQQLQSDPAVGSFELAPEEQGGSGCTLVFMAASTKK